MIDDREIAKSYDEEAPEKFFLNVKRYGYESIIVYRDSEFMYPYFAFGKGMPISTYVSKFSVMAVDELDKHTIPIFNSIDMPVVILFGEEKIFQMTGEEEKSQGVFGINSLNNVFFSSERLISL